MSDDEVTASVRKFLKQVGVTSQQAIERAVAERGPAGPVTVTARITCPEIGLDHRVDSTIETGSEQT